jgi:energy-coupling factor transport system permease protein
VVEILDAPDGVDTHALLARANPVAKVSIAVAVAAALLPTIDAVTAGTALGLELLALPWAGLPLVALLRRGWVVAVGAASAGSAAAMFGTGGGRVLLHAGLATVSSGSLAAGGAITLRVLAIGLPGVVLLATTDPTDLADALAQVLHLPYRFVLSALAAMRLFGVLAEEWQALSMARRARGLGGSGRLGQAVTAPGQVFALLVLAIRRATTLAVVMEARGFGADAPRTWARPSRLTARDWWVMAGGLLLGVTATATGLAAGTWRLLLH